MDGRRQRLAGLEQIDALTGLPRAADASDAVGHEGHAGDQPDGFRIFSDGVAAYDRIFAHIERARRRIEVRAFVWRDDETGRAVARALLAAANRGVEVTIFKDRVAASYEYHGGTRQSLFHKDKGLDQRLQAWFLDRAYAVKGPVNQDPSPEAAALLAHACVRVEHAHKRFDHAKVWVFDDEVLMLGGMGIGDDHRHQWVDFMVELPCAAAVQRLQQRLGGHSAFEHARSFDFLAHSRLVHGRRCEMLEQRLALIDGAERSLHVAMAYLGDARFTRALLAAVHRGVTVSLITSARADVMGNINRATCNKLLARAGHSDRLRIFLHPQVVHAKAIVIDGRLCDVGSANFTPLSHGVYDEVNLYVNHQGFAERLQDALRARAEESEPLSGRIATTRTVLLVERAVVAYMSRRAAGRALRHPLP